MTCDEAGVTSGAGVSVVQCPRVTDGPPMVSVPHLVTNVSLIVTL